MEATETQRKRSTDTASESESRAHEQIKRASRTGAVRLFACLHGSISKGDSYWPLQSFRANSNAAGIQAAQAMTMSVKVAWRSTQQSYALRHLMWILTSLQRGHTAAWVAVVRSNVKVALLQNAEVVKNKLDAVWRTRQKVAAIRDMAFITAGRLRGGRSQLVQTMKMNHHAGMIEGVHAVTRGIESEMKCRGRNYAVRHLSWICMDMLKGSTAGAISTMRINRQTAVNHTVTTRIESDLKRGRHVYALQHLAWILANMSRGLVYAAVQMIKYGHRKHLIHAGAETERRLGLALVSSRRETAVRQMVWCIARLVKGIIGAAVQSMRMNLQQERVRHAQAVSTQIENQMRLGYRTTAVKHMAFALARMARGIVVGCVVAMRLNAKEDYLRQVETAKEMVAMEMAEGRKGYAIRHLAWIIADLNKDARNRWIQKFKLSFHFHRNSLSAANRDKLKEEQFSTKLRGVTLRRLNFVLHGLLHESVGAAICSYKYNHWHATTHAAWTTQLADTFRQEAVHQRQMQDLRERLSTQKGRLQAEMSEAHAEAHAVAMTEFAAATQATQEKELAVLKAHLKHEQRRIGAIEAEKEAAVASLETRLWQEATRLNALGEAFRRQNSRAFVLFLGTILRVIQRMLNQDRVAAWRKRTNAAAVLEPEEADYSGPETLALVYSLTVKLNIALLMRARGQSCREEEACPSDTCTVQDLRSSDLPACMLFPASEQSRAADVIAGMAREGYQGALVLEVCYALLQARTLPGGLRLLWRLVDRNREGSIKLPDFARGMQLIGEGGMQLEGVLQLFSAVDGGFAVTYPEFVQVVCALLAS